MSERINTPYTSEHFVAFCLSMLGQPYWYGTVVYKCSETLRSRKANQYPSHYGSSRTARYKQDIANKKVCADCVGLIKGYNWTSAVLASRKPSAPTRPSPASMAATVVPTSLPTACSPMPRARAVPEERLTHCPRSRAWLCVPMAMSACMSVTVTLSRNEASAMAA